MNPANSASWPRRSTVIALVAIAAFLGLFALGAASASAATPAPEPTSGQVQHCDTVIHELAPGERTSKVISQTCTTVSRSATSFVSPACGCGTLLETFYENLNYGGYSDSVYGDSGTCDSSGYGIQDMSGVNYLVNNASSYKLYGACNVSEMFTATYFTGTSSGLIFGQNQSYVGATFNDNIHSFWVLHG